MAKSKLVLKETPVPEAVVDKNTPHTSLGADRTALTGYTSTDFVNPVAPVFAQPDNSKEGLEKNKLIADSRAFVRGKGFADHLYSDDTVIAEYNRFKKFMETHSQDDFEVKLDQPTFEHTDAGVVVSAEYTTDPESDKFYKAPASDPATPATLVNEDEVVNQEVK